MTLSYSQGKTIVKTIRNHSSAEQAGISVNDEIIGCNGIRANKKSLDIYVSTVELGDEIDILFARDEQIFSTTVIVGTYEKPKFQYIIEDNMKTNKLSNYWLR